MKEPIEGSLPIASAGKRTNLSGLKFDSSAAQPVIDLILPAHNEVESIQFVVSSFYNEIITKLPGRLIIAEDGSTDGTREKLFSLRNSIPISVFSSPQRKGYAKGVSDALKKCSAPWIFFSDSDGQYYPSNFWQLWKNREGYDMIIGRKLYRSDGVHRTVLSNGFHGMANRLFGLSLRDADCGFRLIRKSLIDSVVWNVRFLEYSFWTEFTIRANLAGYRILEVPINHSNRPHGGTQIYKPSRIPIIVLKQLKGLAELYSNTRNGC